MKIQDSGMPEEVYWETLFNADAIVESFGWLNDDVTANQRAIEFGCGYGTFTSRLAECFAGGVDALEMDAEMIVRTRRRLGGSSESRARLHHLDFMKQDWPASTAGADVAVLFHILHGDDPLSLLRRVAKHLRPQATIAVLHWRSDRPTPRGPAMETRPTLENVCDWAVQLGAAAPIVHTLQHSPHHIAATLQLP